jgi:hypothetical protein
LIGNQSSFRLQTPSSSFAAVLLMNYDEKPSWSFGSMLYAVTDVDVVGGENGGKRNHHTTRMNQSFNQLFGSTGLGWEP